jgi:hypothetical protein
MSTAIPGGSGDTLRLFSGPNGRRAANLPQRISRPAQHIGASLQKRPMGSGPPHLLILGSAGPDANRVASSFAQVRTGTFLKDKKRRHSRGVFLSPAKRNLLDFGFLEFDVLARDGIILFHGKLLGFCA